MNPTTLLFELTTRCNLRCPYCYRAKAGKIENIDFDIDLLKNIPLENIKGLTICGTVGDFIFYPKLKEFIKECYRRNPRLLMGFHTNGTAHNKKWWIDFADILKYKTHNVVFGIDGFEDTYKLHRIGGSYKRVINNMKTFIEAGGTASWQFIVFKHNEHQLTKASALARELGCEDFIVRKSFMFDGPMEKPDCFPNLITRSEYGKKSNTKINCRIDDGEVSILANGDVMPCCHIIKKHQEYYDFTPLNLKRKHLDDIIKDGYIQKVGASRYEKDMCQQCRAEKRSYNLEQFVLEILKTRRL